MWYSDIIIRSDIVTVAVKPRNNTGFRIWRLGLLADGMFRVPEDQLTRRYGADMMPADGPTGSWSDNEDNHRPRNDGRGDSAVLVSRRRRT